MTAKTVLVVEDDADLAEALALVLEEHGYRAALASNGRDALQRLSRMAAPALILLDLMMPVMNGWQFRQVQRHDPKLSRVPVAVISAVNRVGDRAAELEAAAYLAKPVSTEQLLATVDRLAQHGPAS